MDDKNKLYTMAQISQYLQLSREKIAELIKKENFPAQKIGNQWRFYLHEVDEWIKTQKHNN